MDLGDLFISNWADNSQIVVINNNRRQLFISFLKNMNLLRSFSTGYILRFMEIFKKELRTKMSSFILTIKTIFSIIEKFFIKSFFVFHVKGTKKNFFKWLNFFRIKLDKLRAVFYLYSPLLRIGNHGVKKIKSIKRKFKKKYIYGESFV